MLYTDNVKKNKYYLICVAFFSMAYICFLVFDWQQQQNPQQQQLEIINANNIDALIFGGSNATNSLSARQLSAVSNERWHNASMAGELGSQIAYEKFILKVASKKNKDEFKVVVYSSILPYTSNSIKKYTERRPDGFKIIPSFSIAGYLKSYFINRLDEAAMEKNELNKDELIFNSFGDFTNPKKNCFYNINKNKFNPETVENSTNFLVNKSYFLATNFPNSKIYITLPSLYYASQTSKFLIYTAKLKESFNRNLYLMHPKLTDRITLIVQPLYPIIDDVCSDPHHATALGRIWRTNDLLKSMVDSIK